MKKFIRGGFIIIVSLVSHNCFGYFYELFINDKVVDTDMRQIIIALSDYHLKSHPANKVQRMYLESLLKKCAAAKGKLIVEDLSSVNNDGRMVCCNFGVNCSEGVLGQLANKARALGIAVDNVEYRYCRVAGIGPLLNNIQENPHSFQSSSTITMPSLHKEIVDEIEKIRRYNDGKFLNNLYKHAIAKVQAALSKMGFATKNITVADYCASLQRKQYRQELEKLCIFDSALVDMNIMHAIAACSHDPLILILAGGSHIEQVNLLLKRMGYTSVLKKSAIAAPKVKKVLNSDSADVPSDIHPQPVDITIIDRFIP